MPTKPSTGSRSLVICRGTPEQLGICQGEALADLVRRSPTILDQLEPFRLSAPRFLPYPVFRWLARRKAAAIWRRTLNHLVPDAAARIDGIARGAGAPRDTLQLLNLMEPVLSDLRDIADTGPIGGCSAIAIRGRRSADGIPVIARNFDYLPLVQPYYVVREVRPAKGFRSLEFTLAPLAGAVDGVNEEGLAITCNYAYVVDRPTPSATITMSISQALATCATVVEAEVFFTANRAWGGGILMLADASGDLVSLEISNTHRHARRPPHGEDLLHHTNRFQTKIMGENEVDDGAHYGPKAPVALRGVRIHDSSDFRDERFRELLADDQELSLADLGRIMSDHGRDGTPANNTICMHGNYWYTTASAQLLPRQRRLRVAFDTACNATYSDYQL